ncbi:ATP-binding protein [Actinoplanes philippinensis]|uniref:ATP-binding protein n=1 Tax=Actinoplanes philippinensis TaxID=35752 RepID=UPI0033FA6B32
METKAASVAAEGRAGPDVGSVAAEGRAGPGTGLVAAEGRAGPGAGLVAADGLAGPGAGLEAPVDRVRQMVTRQFEPGTAARRGQLAVDGGIAVLAFVISLLPLTAEAAPGWSFVVLAGNTLPLVLRRQSPLLANLLIAPSAVIFGLAGWPSPLVPVGPLVALHAIAAYGRRTHSYAFLALALLAAPAVLMLRPAEYEPYEWLNLALAAVVAWLAGTLTAARRRETRQFEERMAAERALRHAETERATAESERAAAESERAAAESERAAAESERAAAESERAAAEERNRIARDMHDVLGHSVAVMVVLAEGAAASAEAGQVDPATLELIAATGRRTMAELRATLGPLRSSAPAPATSDVGAPVGAEGRRCVADSPSPVASGVEVLVGAEGRRCVADSPSSAASDVGALVGAEGKVGATDDGDADDAREARKETAAATTVDEAGKSAAAGNGRAVKSGDAGGEGRAPKEAVAGTTIGGATDGGMAVAGTSIGGMADGGATDGGMAKGGATDGWAAKGVADEGGDCGGLREPPGSGDIAALVATVRRAGTVAELRDELAAPIGGAAGLAAYRIVQEALTNALKHAPGAAVTVEMAEGDDGPWITVGNHRGDMRGPVIEGQGLRNMRERATAVGGTVELGPVGDRWLVTLRLIRGYGR